MRQLLQKCRICFNLSQKDSSVIVDLATVFPIAQDEDSDGLGTVQQVVTDGRGIRAGCFWGVCHGSIPLFPEWEHFLNEARLSTVQAV